MNKPEWRLSERIGDEHLPAEFYELELALSSELAQARELLLSLDHSLAVPLSRGVPVYGEDIPGLYYYAEQGIESYLALEHTRSHSSALTAMGNYSKDVNSRYHPELQPYNLYSTITASSSVTNRDKQKNLSHIHIMLNTHRPVPEHSLFVRRFDINNGQLSDRHTYLIIQNNHVIRTDGNTALLEENGINIDNISDQWCHNLLATIATRSLWEANNIYETWQIINSISS